MTAKADEQLVREALVRFRNVSHLHQFGGTRADYKLAVAALEAWERLMDTGKQLSLFVAEPEEDA